MSLEEDLLMRKAAEFERRLNVLEESQYTDAMSRHGTSAFTEADKRLTEAYLAQRRAEAEGGERSSLGSSSSTSIEKQKSAGVKKETVSRKPVHSVESRSERDREDNSSVRSTGGSGRTE